jgi:pimeloyl-ACP methyl ester carboxylesterase
MTGRPTLLLLAGNMCDARLWDGMRPALAGWPVATPALVDDDSIAGMAGRCLDRHAGQLIPIGFSMGGIVALAIAALAPERIAALGLIDTNPSADLPERAAVRPRQQEEVRAGGLERVVVEELKPNYLALANRGNRPMLGLLRDMALGLGPEVFRRQSEALRTRPDQSASVAALDRPIFLACGAEDRLCPPLWHERMAAAARDAELHVVPGAGHMLPLEQPEALSSALAAWLARIEREVACPIAS